MVSTKVFASKEKQKVLDSWGIQYCVDQDLNFMFTDEITRRKAIQIIKNALVY